MKDRTHSDITLGRLLATRDILARVVARYGTTYLPLFLRIEKEIREMEEQQGALARALDIAARPRR